MLIAFDRDRSDRYPGAVYSHLIAFCAMRGVAPYKRVPLCRGIPQPVAEWRDKYCRQNKKR